MTRQSTDGASHGKHRPAMVTQQELRRLAVLQRAYRRLHRDLLRRLTGRPRAKVEPGVLSVEIEQLDHEEDAVWTLLDEVTEEGWNQLAVILDEAVFYQLLAKKDKAARGPGLLRLRVIKVPDDGDEHPVYYVGYS